MHWTGPDSKLLPRAFSSNDVCSSMMANLQRVLRQFSVMGNRVSLAGLLVLTSLYSSEAVLAQPPGIGGSQSGDVESSDGMSAEDYGSGGDYGMEGDGMDPYGANGGNLRADISGAIDGGLSKSLSQFDFISLLAPTQGAQLPKGPILLGQASEAFSRGHQKLAMDLYFGHMVAEFEDAGPAFKAVKYAKALRRPVWQVRWGVSISTKLDGVSEAKPLTADSRPANNGFDSGGLDSGGFEGGGSEGGGMEGGGMESGREGFPGMRSSAQNALPVVAEVNAGEILENNMGLVATMFAEQFSSRFQNGAFGSALPSMAPPPVEVPANALAAGNSDSGYDDMSSYDPSMEGMGEAGRGPDGMGPGGAGKPADPLLSLAPPPVTPGADALPMWIPGIVFVGEGQSTVTLQSAKEAGIELLVHFDVIAKARGTETQNISRCKVFQVSTGKTLISTSKGIDSLEATQLVRAGRSTNTDYVTEQMLNIWAYIDRDLSATALPQLTPAAAKVRVGMIVTSPPRERLQALAEIRMFEAAGLLPPEDVALAFDLVAGDDAMELLYGPVSDRRELVRSWASE